MLQWLRNLLGLGRPTLKGRYDSAQTTSHNKRHWGQADALSARAANSLHVRTVLRHRSRYEVQNNPWARGIVNRWSNYLIGTGPRLQLQLPDRAMNQQVEARWEEWALEVGLIDSARLMKKAKIQDGEGIGLLRSNPDQRNPVKLYPQVIETDQVSTPQLEPASNAVDGIELDRMGNPAFYHVLKEHPGDGIATALTAEYDRIPAKLVLQWMRKDRPGQLRGIPELTSTLELFALLRRYSLATVASAEVGASLSTVLETDTPPGGEAAGATPFELLEYDRGQHMVVPAGWKLKAFPTEQPTSSYESFESAVVRQIAAALDIPFGLAVGDFSGSNYSSGRLDVQAFVMALGVERQQCVWTVLDPIFFAWLEEALLIEGYLPAGLPPVIPHIWRWPGMPHVDPMKEMNAKLAGVNANLTTLAAACLDYDGSHWEDVFRQRAAEVNLANQLGIVQVAPGQVPAPGRSDQEQQQALDEEGMQGEAA